jgi:site-specific recombinase XerD
VVGINSAQRISDLLELQVGQFLDDDLHIKPRFWIKEQKRGKRQEVVVNTSIRETLEEYFSAYPELIGDQYNYVFFNTKANGFMQPIRRGQAWKIISNIANRWVCVATSVHTVCEKHGDTTLVCKVLI